MQTRNWTTIDYYAALGVSPDASDEEIGRAFRSLAKRLHPDRNGAAVEETEEFKRVTVAYEVLSNPAARERYDGVRRRVDLSGAHHPEGPHEDAAPSPPVRKTPHLRFLVNRRRARLAIVGGIVCSLLGVGVGVLVASLEHRDATFHRNSVPVVATIVPGTDPHVLTFRTVDGRTIRVQEPPRANPGVDGKTVKVRYDRADPTQVRIDESTTARDITLWIVAVKLFIGGPVFLVLGVRALHRL